MISTDDDPKDGASQRRRALRRLGENAATLRRQRAALAEAGLSGDELDRAMVPLLSFHAGLEDEVAAYAAGRSSGTGGSPA